MEKTLQQEIDEYNTLLNLKYEKYVVNFYNLNHDNNDSVIKQLFKENLHLILSDEGLNQIKELSKKNYLLYHIN